MQKKNNRINFKVDDDERSDMEKAASEQGVSLSAYMRSLHAAAGTTKRKKTTPPKKDLPPVEDDADQEIEVHRVDDLGDDDLRRDDGALTR